jgi:hypothetical protein
MIDLLNGQQDWLDEGKQNGHLGHTETRPHQEKGWGHHQTHQEHGQETASRCKAEDKSHEHSIHCRYSENKPKEQGARSSAASDAQDLQDRGGQQGERRMLYQH